MDGDESPHDLVGGSFAVVESDPGVFTSLMRKLGVGGLEVTEVYGTEPWATDHLNAYGLIFCFLCPEEDGRQTDGDDEDLEDPDARSVWFASQLSDDACASQAMLNVLLNCDGIDIGDELRELRADTEKMSSVMKGLAISNSAFIREAQNSLARPADIRGALHAIAKTTLESSRKLKPPPAKKRKKSGSRAKVKASEGQVDSYHFIGYVPAQGKVWELDGLRSSGPLEVGELASEDAIRSWIDVVRPALNMKMKSLVHGGDDHIQYNLLAIIDDPYLRASDELEMLKRKRNALQRRLDELHPLGWHDKVDPVVLASASEAFSTSVRPFATQSGPVFSGGFGAQKMDMELSILDMPTRNLIQAWEACVNAAIPAKIAVEEEIVKSKSIHIPIQSSQSLAKSHSGDGMNAVCGVLCVPLILELSLNVRRTCVEPHDNSRYGSDADIVLLLTPRQLDKVPSVPRLCPMMIVMIHCIRTCGPSQRCMSLLSAAAGYSSFARQRVTTNSRFSSHQHLTETMAAIVLLLQAGFIFCATWVLWYLLRSLFIPSPFDNIPGPPSSKSWIKGHYAQLFDRNGWEFQRELGERYGPVVKINGLFGDKQLYVFDPVALHHIIVKDQYIYEETSTFITSNSLLFGKGLLATLGDHHRRQRKLLNPVFSINNMRHMLPIFYKISGSLRNAIAAKLDDGPKEIDILNWMCRTALELIGQGGLGYSFDPLVHDVANPYGDVMKSLGFVFHPRCYSLIPILAKIGSPVFRRRVVELIPYKPYQRVLEIVDIMDTRSKEVFYAKKAAMKKGDEAVLAQFGEGKDIMSRLLQANMAASVEDKLSDDELLGQMSSLIFAAMDTTATGLSHILNLLAEHQDVQEKLRREVTEARDNRGDIPYDELVELPYLDAVCRETLRLYAPVSFDAEGHRFAVGKSYQRRDGTLIHEIPIPNNTNIIIAILASNRNPALWGPDAHEWKPERWLTALPATVGEARVPGIYSNLLTFLGGGRACIGFKFSQMEMKVVLSVLLESFKFSLPKERLMWNFGGIQYPSAGDDPKPRLPMKVELVKSV
ncbi:Ubiquitin carboxyl-terminal hydrolase isozyme L5 [Grifola frondosa]|uniref:ubiquitinyl hydrolase 1 n=1 Tax=Grifola frondosa TaxID=5627 RepID=A0A1C7M9E9_GRIFR|nr:Ubiquitin carboxyl-terminal hydrolase isozyme L5 [Grifola frondosa]